MGSNMSIVPQLHSTQEKGDNIMMLHAKYDSGRGTNTIVVLSLDTEDLVHHHPAIQEVYLLTGGQDKYINAPRFVPIHHLHDASNDIREILLSLYCLVGGNTVNRFCSIGKRSVFHHMVNQAKNLQIIIVYPK